MSGLGRGSSSSGSKHGITLPTGSDTLGRPNMPGGGYPDDGARRMPSISSAVSLEAAKRKRLQLSSGSGRTSTNLAGTQSYINSFLGGVG